MPTSFTLSAMCTSTPLYTQNHGDGILDDQNLKCPSLMLVGVEVIIFFITLFWVSKHFSDGVVILVGKTVCLGQRLAKLELKAVLSLYLLEFKSDLVNVSGRRPDSLPRPNWNDSLTCKPPSGSYTVEYTRRKTPFTF